MKIKIRNFKYIIFIFITLFTIYFKSVGLAYETINQKDFSISLVKRKVLYSKNYIDDKSANSLLDNSSKELNNSINVNLFNFYKINKREEEFKDGK